MVLCLGTWPEVFCHINWTCWVDNQAVLHAILKGSGLSPEANSIIGALWFELALRDVGCFCGRVESLANLADGPTREKLEWVDRLQATWCDPVWPPWAFNFWTL